MNTRTVSMMSFRRAPGEALKSVLEDEEVVILTRWGVEAVAIIPCSDLDALEALSEFDEAELADLIASSPEKKAARALLIGWLKSLDL